MDIEQKREYMDALNTYYKLKNEYQSNLDKDKKKIIKMKDLSLKEKRIEFSKLKPKCINCKRPVGTIFTTLHEDENRTLIAKCGDKTNPCPLNIAINLGYIVNLHDQLQSDEEHISEIKKQIIIDKNDLLFGYMSSREAVAKFDAIKDSFSSEITNYEYSLQLFMNIVDNKEKNEELKKEQLELQIMIDNVKKMISDFDKTRNVDFIKDAVEIYVKNMSPMLEEFSKKKYAYSAIEYNPSENIYQLVQIPFSVESLEVDLAEKPQGVVSLQMGMDRRVKTRNKTVKNVKNTGEEMKIVLPKKQTKKNRMPTLVLEPSEEGESAPATPVSVIPSVKLKLQTENEEEQEHESESETVSEPESESEL